MCGSMGHDFMGYYACGTCGGFYGLLWNMRRILWVTVDHVANFMGRCEPCGEFYGSLWTMRRILWVTMRVLQTVISDKAPHHILRILDRLVARLHLKADGFLANDSKRSHVTSFFLPKSSVIALNYPKLLCKNRKINK